MSVTYGFYNSYNGDRKYNAEDVSRMFDGLITDGIFMSIGDSFAVKADSSGEFVTVGTGRGWFNNTWINNDEPLIVNFDVASAGMNRIDTVVIDIDIANRTNSIKVVKGNPTSATPTPPTLTKGENATSYQYPLCHVQLGRTAGYQIKQEHITNLRGLESEGTPWIKGVLESVSVDDLVAQWNDRFDNWFRGVKNILDGEVEGNIANRLLDHDVSISTLFSELNYYYGKIEPYMSEVPSVQNRNVYRGKWHGNKITDAKYTAIRNGSFEDICVGDYWTFAGTNWRIVDIDYWIRPQGETRHHILLMPDEPIGILPAKADPVTLEPIASTEGGYYHSSLNAGFFVDELFALYKDTPIQQRLSHTEYLVNAVDSANGKPTNGGWYDVKQLVPSEIMIYGTKIWSHVSGGVATDHLFISSLTQLAAFRLNPSLIFCESRYWLQDTVSNNQFALVLEKNGTANRAKASSSYGYRPIVMIG